MNKIRISGIVKESIVDGPGIRYTLFTQGCPHHCDGCHNPKTHDMKGGWEVTVQEIVDDFKKNPLLKGITISGGEPFVQASALTPLAQQIKQLGKDVMVYTGYTFEQLLDSQSAGIPSFLLQIDILIDGKFELSKRDLTLKFRGSSNQRILDCPQSLTTHKPKQIEL